VLSIFPIPDVAVPDIEKRVPNTDWVIDEAPNVEWEGEVDVSDYKEAPREVAVGRIIRVEKLQETKVKAWIR